MGDWFDELHNKRVAWIDSTRQNDFERGIKNLTVDKYTDPLHFVYELLQNAEDQDATSAEFVLRENSLEFCHNGKPFNQGDVESITGIGNTQKAGQANKIGCFGIGFKSVFEITHRPEIYAALNGQPFAFAIKDQVVPEPLPYPASKFKASMTRFVFPFKPEGNYLYPQIKNKLRELGADTLLFLDHLESIHWQTETEEGTYLSERNEPPYEWCRLISEAGAKSSEKACHESNYLRFSRPSSVKSELAVRLAFRVEDNTILAEEGLPTLNVFFPTSEKTNLKFRLHAPMLLTDSRANIKTGNETNQKLIEDCAALLAESLPLLKAKGLLNAECLECLPIRPVDFPPASTFRPLYNATRDALQTQELLPTATGSSRSHVRVNNAKISESGTVRELLDQTHLSQLHGRTPAMPVCWLSEKITKGKKDIWHYLQSELGVKEIDLEEFAGMLEASFLEKQSDAWMQKFYVALLEVRSQWEKGRPNPRLRKKEIIRLEDGSHVTPFSKDEKPNAFLPASVDIGLPTVKRSLLSGETGDNANRFLLDLGLTQPEIVDRVLHTILPKYDGKLQFVEQAYIDDLMLIADAIETCQPNRRTDLLAALRSAPFILGCIPATKKLYWKYARDVYQSTPNILLWFDGCPDVYLVSSRLEKHKAWTAIRDFINDKQPVLRTEIRILARTPETQNYVSLINAHGRHERGLNGFDPDASIDGLEHALKNITVDKAHILWHILFSKTHLLKGYVEKSAYTNFKNPSKDFTQSHLYKLCTSRAWLPNAKGGFHKPSDITLNELPDNFEKHSDKAKELSDKLDMKRIDILDKEREAKEFEEFKKHRGAFLEWQREQKQVTLPETNEDYSPERGKKLLERQQDSPDVTYASRMRSTRISSTKMRDGDRAFLIQCCTTDDDEMICQICCEEMPFKVGDDYYFEAVRFCKVSVKEIIRNKIALCPVCAAKWLYANKHEAEELRQKILSCKPQDDLPVTLAGKPEIVHFWGDHLGDLQALLRGVEASPND